MHDGTNFYIPKLETLLKYRIIISTNSTAAKLYNLGVPKGHFTLFVFDESSYSLEPEILSAITTLGSNSH